MAAKRKVEEWGVEYFRRHISDDPGEAAPGREFRTVLSKGDYAEVRKLGDEYLARNPRSILA
jgi:hypothetical protein